MVALICAFFLLPTSTVLPRITKCVRAPIKMGLVFLDHEEVIQPLIAIIVLFHINAAILTIRNVFQEQATTRRADSYGRRIL